MTGVLIKGGNLDIEIRDAERSPRVGEGTDPSDASKAKKHQRVPAKLRNQEEARKDPSSQSRRDPTLLTP